MSTILTGSQELICITGVCLSVLTVITSLLLCLAVLASATCWASPMHSFHTSYCIFISYYYYCIFQYWIISFSLLVWNKNIYIYICLIGVESLIIYRLFILGMWACGREMQAKTLKVFWQIILITERNMFSPFRVSSDESCENSGFRLDFTFRTLSTTNRSCKKLVKSKSIEYLC